MILSHEYPDQLYAMLAGQQNDEGSSGRGCGSSQEMPRHWHWRQFQKGNNSLHVNWCICVMIAWCNDDIYYRRWIIVLFWVSLWWHYRRYELYYMNCNRLITHINDHYWWCLNVVIIRQNVPNVACMKRLIVSYSLLSDISGGRQPFIKPLNMVNIIWINRKVILISRGCFLTKELWSI